MTEFRYTGAAAGYGSWPAIRLEAQRYRRELVAHGAPTVPGLGAEPDARAGAGKGMTGYPARQPLLFVVLSPQVGGWAAGEISLVRPRGSRALTGQSAARRRNRVQGRTDLLAGGRKIAGILVEAEKLPDEPRRR